MWRVSSTESSSRCSIKPSFGRAWCSSNTMNNEILATFRALLGSQGYHLHRQIGRDYLFGLDESQPPNLMSILREPE